MKESRHAYFLRSCHRDGRAGSMIGPITNRYWEPDADDAKLLAYADETGRLTVSVPELVPIFGVSQFVLYSQVRRLGLKTQQKRGLWNEKSIEALSNLCDAHGRLTLPLRDAAAYFCCSIGTIRQQVRKLKRQGRFDQPQPPTKSCFAEPPASRLPHPEHHPHEEGPGPAILIVYAFMLAWGLAIGIAVGAYLF